MKINTLFTFAAASIFITACGEDPVTVDTTPAVDVAPVEETATSIEWTVDPQASSLIWEGEKLGKYKHNGTVAIASGTMTTEDGKIIAGEYTVDMTSMQCTDITESEKATKLINHLSNHEFFNVDTYPTSTFEITGCEPGNNDTTMIMGNLKILDVTNNITIPAIISTDGNTFKATSSFAIDRVKWGIEYGSGVTGIMDNIISDEIQFDLSLVGNKN